MERKRLINTPGDFTIYKSTGNPGQCFAIYPDQIKIMDEIRLKYLDRLIPEKYTILAYKFGKIKDKDPAAEIWDITDQNPVACRVNDLISDKIGFLYCY